MRRSTNLRTQGAGNELMALPFLSTPKLSEFIKADDTLPKRDSRIILSLKKQPCGVDAWAWMDAARDGGLSFLV